MPDGAGSVPSKEPIQFVATEGTPVSVGRRDKAERIREAIIDLQLVIDGCDDLPRSRFRDAAAALARHCAIFLRKMVLGDERNRRLLTRNSVKLRECASIESPGLQRTGEP